MSGNANLMRIGPNAMKKEYKTYSDEIVRAAANVVFMCHDLGTEMTVQDWLKKILCEFLMKTESFSGKRPFGNGAWDNDAIKALIKAGVLTGEVDQDDDLCDSKDATPLFLAIVHKFVVT